MFHKKLRRNIMEKYSNKHLERFYWFYFLWLNLPWTLDIVDVQE
jgi:hypothetical protein